MPSISLFGVRFLVPALWATPGPVARGQRQPRRHAWLSSTTFVRFLIAAFVFFPLALFLLLGSRHSSPEPARSSLSTSPVQSSLENSRIQRNVRSAPPPPTSSISTSSTAPLTYRTDFDAERILCIHEDKPEGSPERFRRFSDIPLVFDEQHQPKLEYFRTRYERMKMDWWFGYQKWLHRNRDHLRMVPMSADSEGRVPACPSPRKKVLVFMGAAFLMGLMGKGAGPQGDIMQWTDLTVAMLMLGVAEVELVAYIHQDLGARLLEYDLILTDIHGFAECRQFLDRAEVKPRIRILAVYGVDRADKEWFADLPEMHQYWSFVPGFSPENSFLGFTVPSFRPAPTGQRPRRKWKALIWGKNPQYLENALPYLKTLRERYGLELHATAEVTSKSPFPAQLAEYIQNHGILTPSEYQELMDETLALVGLTDPLTGPSPLEAMAQGLVYLNYGYQEPRVLGNGYVNLHPTRQPWTSQFPFLEHQVGWPHVLTVHPHNVTDLDDKMQQLRGIYNQLQMQEPSAASSVTVQWLSEYQGNLQVGYVPEEFTTVGMLERVMELVVAVATATAGDTESM